MPSPSPTSNSPVARWLSSLDVQAEDQCPDLGWLEASWREPAAFWANLSEYAAGLAVPPRSRVGVSCDLYSDAIQRHATGALSAFVWFDARQGFCSLSFAELHARASALAGAWRAQGAAPGDTLALVLPLGPEYVVALAAALRLGLCISALAPEGGASYLARRLAQLKPAHLVLDERLPAEVGQFAELALKAVQHRVGPLTPAYVYGPREPCARLFSPLREAHDSPLELSAEVAYQNALRDGVLAFRLAPGRRFAAPGFHAEQHHPALLFCSLLAGATFVHLSVQDLRRDPTQLRAQKVDTLGVTCEVRDLLRAQPGLISSVCHWFKSVDEPLEWLLWRDFAAKNCIDSVYSSNVLIDAGVGGCVLFSTRRPRSSIHTRVLPAAGRSFCLMDPAGAPANAEPRSSGVLVAAPEKQGFFLLARAGVEYLWGSTWSPRRGARVFPAAELCAMLASLPGLAGAQVVPVPSGIPSGRFLFVLLLFTGATRPEELPATRVRATIVAAFGVDFLPDELVMVPLFPRTKDGIIDDQWCRAQYLSGRLARKVSDPKAAPVFAQLTALRALLSPDAAPR